MFDEHNFLNLFTFVPEIENTLERDFKIQASLGHMRGMFRAKLGILDAVE